MLSQQFHLRLFICLRPQNKGAALHLTLGFTPAVTIGSDVLPKHLSPVFTPRYREYRTHGDGVTLCWDAIGRLQPAHLPPPNQPPQCCLTLWIWKSTSFMRGWFSLQSQYQTPAFHLGYSGPSIVVVWSFVLLLSCAILTGLRPLRSHKKHSTWKHCSHGYCCLPFISFTLLTSRRFQVGSKAGAIPPFHKTNISFHEKKPGKVTGIPK